ncbi:MAG: hypothetical protein M1824_004371 [Vezdaea acicularis]|nr:MAG: hypothetical protein M1824_004371 [Vezdaea acicularis]
MAGGQKRIAKELADILKNPPTGVTAKLIDEADIYVWHCTISGPEDTPYKGGTFHTTLTLPPTYPFKAPTITFETRTYHPNIISVSASPTSPSGSMCLPILKQEVWKPSTKLRDALVAVRELLRYPDVENAVEGSIAEEYIKERSAWEKTAKEYTSKYAK